MRTLLAATVALLLVAAPAQAAPGWLPVEDGLVRSTNTLDSAGAAFLADGTLLSLTRFQAAGGSAVVTDRPAGGPVRAPVVLDPTGDRTLVADLAVDTTGAAAAVAWVAVHEADSTRRVRVATRTGAGAWSEPVTLATAPGLAAVAVGVRADGQAAVVWRTADTASLKVPGADPVTLTAGGETAGPLDVAVDGAGVVYGGSVGVSNMNHTVRVRAVAPGADPATAPTNAYAFPGSVLSVALSPTAGGVRTAMAVSFIVDQVQQYVVRPNGTRTDPAVVSEDDADAVQAVTGPAGDELICWRAAKTLRIARRTPGAATFGSATTLSGTMPTEAIGACGVDAGGTATAAWFEGGGLLASRAARGDGWTTPATLLAEAGAVYFASTRAQVAVAATGDAAVPAGSLFTSEGSRTESRIAEYDAVAPTAPALTVPATAVAGQPVSLAMTAFDVWSWTGSWDFGDGSNGAGAAATHTYAAPGSFLVRGTATDGLGKASTTTQTIEVAAAPVAPGVRPGGGTPVVTPRRKRAAGSVRARFRVRGRRTTVVSLVARGLPKGARVRVGCRRCGKVRTGTTRTRRTTKRLALTRRFARRVLRPGAVITVRVSAKGRRTVTARWTVRRGRAPKRG